MAAIVQPQVNPKILRQSESSSGLRRIPVYLSLAGVAVTAQGSWTGSEIQVLNNGGTFSNFAGTMTETGLGWYHYEATQGELGSCGYFLVRIARAAIDTVSVLSAVQAWNMNDTVNSRPDVNIGSMSNNVITTAAINDGAVTNAKFATGAISAATEGLPGAAVSGTGTTTVFVTTLAETANDYWKDCFVTFTSGVLVGATRRITAYNGTTKAITVEHAFPSVPANAVTFILVNR